MKTFIIFLIGIPALILVSLSWYRNYELLNKRIKNKDLMPSEKYIDYPIKFLWQIYITVFAVGFVVNNIF